MFSLVYGTYQNGQILEGEVSCTVISVYVPMNFSVLFFVVVIVDIFYFHATVSQIIYFLYAMVKSESAMTIVVIIKNKLFNGNIIYDNMYQKLNIYKYIEI